MNTEHSTFSFGHSIARVLLVAGVACIFATPSWADLTGTTAHGSAFYRDDPTSFDLFDPPYPCQIVFFCSSGPTTTVGDGAEFSYYTHDNPTSADFTATSLSVSFMPYYTFDHTIPMGPLTFEFKDEAFVGATVSLLSFSNFSSADKFTYSLNANTITVRVPTYFITSPGFPYEINLRIATLAVPEPATNVAMLGGLLMLGYGTWRRFGAPGRADAGTH